MNNWAEKEIEIACARERAASENSDDWNYGCACYESALKAYKSLMEDGHSGFSIGLTKNILIRLIEGKPLTPIEDTPDIWDGRGDSKDGSHKYQCTRMSSLFKNVHADGSVTYTDVDRVRVTYAASPNSQWFNGNVAKIINEMFPITMPYMPTNKPYIVHAEDFLVDPTCGDYDTTGYLYAISPDGEKIEINRYFAEKEHYKWTEISFEEYCERKKAAHDI